MKPVTCPDDGKELRVRDVDMRIHEGIATLYLKCPICGHLELLKLKLEGR